MGAVVLGVTRVARVVARVFRLVVVEDCCVAASLSSIEVAACWAELASRKLLAERRSDRASVKWVVSFSAMAAAREEERVSAVFSSIRKATERIVAATSLGILGSREAERRIFESFVVL